MYYRGAIQPGSSYLVIVAGAAVSRISACINDAEKTTKRDAEVAAAAESRLRCPSIGLSPAALPIYNIGRTAGQYWRLSCSNSLKVL